MWSLWGLLTGILRRFLNQKYFSGRVLRGFLSQCFFCAHGRHDVRFCSTSISCLSGSFTPSLVSRMLGGARKMVPQANESANLGTSAAKTGFGTARAGSLTLGAVDALAGGMAAGPVGMAAGRGMGSREAGLFTDTAASLGSFFFQAKSEGLTANCIIVLPNL